MPAPWVLFDSSAAYGGDCTTRADPDIAGVGASHLHNVLRTIRSSLQVVLSFVLASIMTTTASILAMVLDQAFDAKAQFTIRAPVRFIRDRILDTEWKKNYAW